MLDGINSFDPNREIVDGQPRPAQVVYAERMTAWLHKLEPNPSEALQLAARGQHVMRWQIPRSDYPMDRAGYIRWRTTLYDFHAEHTGRVLAEVGYDQPFVERVQSLIRKQNLKIDPEAQTLEDVICLVFLENYFAEFAADHDEAKLIRILRKTWKKMSDRGHAAAMTIELGPREKELVAKALST